jgi:hypothetical protein
LKGKGKSKIQERKVLNSQFSSLLNIW